jgi:hypothetical protein
MINLRLSAEYDRKAKLRFKCLAEDVPQWITRTLSVCRSYLSMSDDDAIEHPKLEMAQAEMDPMKHGAL